jgi:hypothetical protein
VGSDAAVDRLRTSVCLLARRVADPEPREAVRHLDCARKSELMTNLIKLATEKIKRFTEDTGQPLDWVHSGSLKVARRKQDAEVIETDIARGRPLGLDLERVSPQEAHRLNPFLRAGGSGRRHASATTCTSTPHRSPSASRAAPRHAGRRCCLTRLSRGSSSTTVASPASRPTKA